MFEPIMTPDLITHPESIEVPGPITELSSIMTYGPIAAELSTFADGLTIAEECIPGSISKDGLNKLTTLA